MKALSQVMMKLSRLQENLVFVPRDLEIRSRSLNMKLDLKISLVHVA